MRILILHHVPLWGSGSGTFVTQLSEELAQNHRVGIVAPDRINIPKNKNISIYSFDLPFHVTFTSLPTWTDAKRYQDLTHEEIYQIYNSFLKHTIRAVEKFRPHVIHVQHAGVLSWVARFIKSVYGIHYIITTHGTDLLTLDNDFRYFPLGLDACRGARKITAVSPDTRDWLVKAFGDEFRKKTTVIPGGVDLKNYPLRMNTKGVKKKYGLQGKSIVLFTGRLTKLKGVKYLIQAAKQIKGEVCIVGGGPEMNELTNIVKQLRLKNVHFLGYFGKHQTEDLRELYYAADVFVAPSVWDEPLGLVILEAMAASTPVVVTRKGGIPLAVKDGHNGIFIKPRNSTSIAKAVNKLLANPKQAKRMGTNARSTVEKKFDWPIIKTKFEKIYEKFSKEW